MAITIDVGQPWQIVAAIAIVLLFGWALGAAK